MKKFAYKSVMQIPKLDKIVIKVGCGEEMCIRDSATPVAIMVGSGVGAKKGVLFKTASALTLKAVED